MGYKPKYFTLKELCASSTASMKNIDNFPSFDVVVHLLKLVECLLDPLREAWGSGIVVSSGFRSRTLNLAVGGSSSSAHLTGYAADLQPSNGKLDEFIEFTRDWLKKNRIRFDQCIDEKNSKGARWLHIGLYGNAGQQRGEFKQLTKI